MDDLETLVEEIRSTDTAAVLTGAGISGPSGVPTFRDNDGVWNAFDEGQFTYGRFQRDPSASGRIVSSSTERCSTSSMNPI